MRVDHHLLRRMLETIEAAPTAEIAVMPELTADAETERYHLQLLIDGGHVTAQQLRRHGRPCALGLTLAGHNLLAQLRRRTTDVAERWMERLLTVSVTRLLSGAC